MATRMIILVRHGQYDLTTSAPDGGSLTILGQRQADATGKALAKLPVTSIIASTMTRAIETANIIAQIIDQPYVTTDLLREALPSIPPRFAPQILDMMQLDPNLTYESIHQDQVRADEAFETYFVPSDAEGHTIDVLVCHGNIIRYLVCKALGVNTDAWAKMNINHAGFSSVLVDENGLLRLVSHNETRHIPLELLTD